MAAKLLATKLTYRVDGEAFAAGILHDISKLILNAPGRVEGNTAAFAHPSGGFSVPPRTHRRWRRRIFAHGEHQEMAKAEALPASPTAKKGKTGGASTVGAAGGG